MGAKKTKKIKPYYSPERNPDEQNCDLKQELSVKKNNQIPWKNDKKTFKKNMEMLETKPDRVMNYFKHQSIKYAV